MSLVPQTRPQHQDETGCHNPGLPCSLLAVLPVGEKFAVTTDPAKGPRAGAALASIGGVKVLLEQIRQPLQVVQHTVLCAPHSGFASSGFAGYTTALAKKDSTVSFTSADKPNAQSLAAGAQVLQFSK